ncbi:hypothetical protein VVD49_10210 [Uliginosibacterium sp. H3]|uniref:Secreted protein n=1 Tax=Uliginosibacterium silvisoli TaxID=3114758 RepID=A0ABU6K522_9RHOO|nr:hypothetical protein [Uliginosibacterium sp. H3]
MLTAVAGMVEGMVEAAMAAAVMVEVTAVETGAAVMVVMAAATADRSTDAKKARYVPFFFSALPYSQGQTALNGPENETLQPDFVQNLTPVTAPHRL